MKNTMNNIINVIVRTGLAVLLIAGLNLMAQQQERVTVYSTQALDTNKNVEVVWIPQYYYHVQADQNGTVEGTPSGWYDSGTEISITAKPNLHYVFEKWENGPIGKETQNPLVFNLTKEYPNLTAKFKLRTYEVTVVSKYTNWFGDEQIGNPSGTGRHPALSSVVVEVDKYVVNPTNQYMRVRASGSNVKDQQDQ